MTALRILVLAPANALRDWPALLAARLTADGHCVTLADTERLRRPAGLDTLFALERILFRLPASRPERAPSSFGGTETHDLVIDLTGEASGAGPTLAPLFDDHPGEDALVSTLLCRRPPVVTVVFTERGEAPRAVARALPALERPDLLTSGVDAVTAAAMALLRDAVRRRARGRPFVLNESASLRASEDDGKAVSSFAVAMLTRRIAARLDRLVRWPAHFRIGWRATKGDAIADRLAWPSTPYTFLKDDGARFYADPFLFAWGGRNFVFCEEYPYAIGKGVISVFEITADGVATAPRPVMEQDWHISYPQVFERDGVIWMVPETSGARCVNLYRATAFPSEWRLEATLIEGLDISDATLCEHEGRLWLLATVAQDGLSGWDALHLFHAERLTGPWIAHPANPVVIDAHAARPAGALFHRGDKLWRPAQDCSRVYGGGLVLCEIERLDTEDFRQRVHTRLEPPASLGAHGAHTLNAGGGLEVIDILGKRRRW